MLGAEEGIGFRQSYSCGLEWDLQIQRKVKVGPALAALSHAVQTPG